MNAIRQFAARLAFLAMLAAPMAANAGIPVFDGSNLIQQIQQVISWSQQFQQMTSQIRTMENQVQSLTGSRGLGGILNDPLLKQVVPADVTNVLSAVNSGGFNGLTGLAKTIRSGVKLYDCDERVGESKQVCQALLNITSQSQAYQQGALDVATKRVAQIQALQDQIDGTADPKAIAELQARLQAESTQVANDANRREAMQALAEAQRYAAEQAVRERGLKLLNNTPKAADSFAFTPPH